MDKISKLGWENIAKARRHFSAMIIVWIAPEYAVSAVMGYLKAKLAIPLLQKYERLGKQFWGRQLWGRGYCGSTVGIDEQHIGEYVKWQEKKEKEIEQWQGNLFGDEQG